MAIGDRISFRNKSKTDILINKNKEDLDIVEDALAGNFDPDAVTDFAGTVKIKGKEIATENYVNEIIAAAGTGDNNVDMTNTFSFVGDGTEKTFAFPFIGNSVAVFIEGIKVPTSDYTLNKNADTSAGESITLNDAPLDGDIISCLAFGGANVYNKSQAEALFLNKTDAENNYISKNNTTEYSPSSDYEPATKKYVDAMASSGGGNVEITKNFRHIATDKQREFSAEYILGSLNVFVNGIQLDTDEYDAADGSADNGKIVLKDEDGVPEGTVVIIVAYGGADVYNKSQADTLIDAKADISYVDSKNIKNENGIIKNNNNDQIFPQRNVGSGFWGSEQTVNLRKGKKLTLLVTCSNANNNENFGINITSLGVQYDTTNIWKSEYFYMVKQPGSNEKVVEKVNEIQNIRGEHKHNFSSELIDDKSFKLEITISTNYTNSMLKIMSIGTSYSGVYINSEIGDE